MEFSKKRVDSGSRGDPDGYRAAAGWDDLPREPRRQISPGSDRSMMRLARTCKPPCSFHRNSARRATKRGLSRSPSLSAMVDRPGSLVYGTSELEMDSHTTEQARVPALRHPSMFLTVLRARLGASRPSRS